MINSPNRAVALATPLVFAPLAGLITTWVAKHVPGVELEEGQVTALFIAGATIALAKSGLWMKGWQEHEKRQELLPVDTLDPANAVAATLDGDADIEGEVAEGVEADAIDDDLDAEPGDAIAEEDPDDLLAQLEAVLAESAAAAQRA